MITVLLNDHQYYMTLLTVLTVVLRLGQKA